MTPQQIELALETIALVLEDLKKTQEKQQATITALEEALAEHAMQEVQRLGQEIEQKIGCVNHDCEKCKAQTQEQKPTSDEMLQAITDPENQPSQYGTVTLDYHLEKIKKWEDLFERMSNKVLAQPKQEPVTWLLTDKNINSIQVDSIQRLISRLKYAHHTDLRVRINGQDEWFEADWLKHMARVAPPQRTEEKNA